MDRPALKWLMAEIEAGKVDCVVVSKVDRLSRSLLDFGRLMEVFDKHRVALEPGPCLPIPAGPVPRRYAQGKDDKPGRWLPDCR
jgi:hypothetical protein